MERKNVGPSWLVILCHPVMILNDAFWARFSEGYERSASGLFFVLITLYLDDYGDVNRAKFCHCGPACGE